MLFSIHNDKKLVIVRSNLRDITNDIHLHQVAPPVWISRPNMINKYLSGSILEIQIFLFILTKTKRIKYILTV